MFRIIALGALAAGVAAGCANFQPVTSGGFYCTAGTQRSCPEHEAYGDCQLCPSATVAASQGDTTPLR
jgi:hypothetical protein